MSQVEQKIDDYVRKGGTDFQDEMWKCNHCEELRLRSTFFNGIYCSEECKVGRELEKVLNEIKYDHKRCFTCLGVLKEVDEPEEHWPDCVVGFQYRVEDGELGLRDHYSNGIREENQRMPSLKESAYAYEIEGETHYQGWKFTDLEDDRIFVKKVREGTICGFCGSTANSLVDDDLRELFKWDFVDRLSREVEFDVDEAMENMVYGDDILGAVKEAMMVT